MSATRERDYGAARAVIGVIEAVGWLLIAAGAIVVAAGFAQGQALYGMIGGAGIAAVGMLQLAMAQIVRAQVDTAMNTARSARALEALVAGGAGSSASGASVAGRGAPVLSGGMGAGSLIKIYKGHELVRDPGGVRVGSRVLAGVVEAERWIDARIAGDGAAPE